MLLLSVGIGAMLGQALPQQDLLECRMRSKFASNLMALTFFKNSHAALATYDGILP